MNNIIRYTRENPLRINTFDDLKNLEFKNSFLRKNFVIYNCPNCKKEKISKMFTIILKDRLLCHQCEIKKSIIEKYGNEEEYYKKSYESYKKTCLEKYGVENMFQLESVKEDIRKKQLENDPTYEKRNEKTRKTCQERYGTDNGGASKEAQEKIRKTKLERYGDPFYTNREKSSETFRKNHQTAESKRKRREKCESNIIKKYGSKKAYYDNIVKKSKQTCLEKYGVEHYNQLEERRLKGFSRFKYCFDDYIFDSSWELAYYIWLKDQDVEFVVHPYPIDYFDETKKINRKYFPDFIVEDEIIEIKGSFLMKNGLLKDSGKQKIIEDLEVAIISYEEIKPYLKYAEDKVGDLSRFRKKKSPIKS